DEVGPGAGELQLVEDELALEERADRQYGADLAEAGEIALRPVGVVDDDIFHRDRELGADADRDVPLDPYAAGELRVDQAQQCAPDPALIEPEGEGLGAASAEPAHHERCEDDGDDAGLVHAIPSRGSTHATPGRPARLRPRNGGARGSALHGTRGQ